jgi:ubiquinone/menaquinone biosynthesis C-methylase UbiE
MSSSYEREVSTHSGPARAAGGAARRAASADLAPMPGSERGHIRGAEATRELAALAGLDRATLVLDLGGGLGGPARTLAAELGCQVIVVDADDAACRMGAELARRAGLAGLVSFRAGSPLALPLDGASVDVVWSQDAALHVADRPGLYAEARRVLRPRGRLAMHDTVAGSVRPMHAPVPWAAEAALVRLPTAGELRATIIAAGFVERLWDDVTEPALAWLRGRIAERPRADATGARRLGLHLLMGDLFRPAAENQIRNLVEHRMAVVEAVFER